MHFEPLRWKAHEYDHYERTTDWYWAVAIITFSIIILSILFSDYLFAIVTLIGVFTLVLFTYRPPKLISYELNRKGVLIEKTLYPYVGLESFWIADHHEFVEPKLIIKSTKVVMPYIIIPLIDVDPEDVHDILRTVIAEEEHHEPLAHKLMEYLGF